jgi:AcrR family transcriptional regulator
MRSAVATPEIAAVESSPRPRGRPRLTIDRDAVADAVAELFHEGGYEAVTIPGVAEKLSVSRATLYRTVPTKQDLMGILYEFRFLDHTQRIRAAIAETDDPAEQLTQLIRLQAHAAVEMRRYMPVFFGGGDLPADVYAKWHTWSRRFDKMWVDVVTANMRAGNLEDGNPVVTTRLILGMLIWVSRWYRPSEKITPEEIADAALNLVRLGYVPPKRPARNRNATGTARRSTPKKRR